MADLSPAVEAELARLRAENIRLRNLLRMTSEQAAPAAPGQAAFFEAPPVGFQNSATSPDLGFRRLARIR